MDLIEVSNTFVENEVSYLSPKCLICNENYNDKERKPLVLTGCGHSFCKACINQFLTKKCAICRVNFEKTVENWLALEIVSLARVSNSIKPFIDKFNYINEENKNQTMTRLDTIRNQINSQYELSIKLIKKSQTYLLDELNYEQNQVNQRYNEIKKDLEQSLISFEENLNSSLNFNYDEKLDNIKRELNRLESKHGLFKIQNSAHHQYIFTSNNPTCLINATFLGCLKTKKDDLTGNTISSVKSNVCVFFYYFKFLFLDKYFYKFFFRAQKKKGNR
jgi:hypothetical protein